jgi:hypothetical protein
VRIAWFNDDWAANKIPTGLYIYIYDIFFFSFFDFSKFEIWNMYKVKGLYIYIYIYMCVCVCGISMMLRSSRKD